MRGEPQLGAYPFGQSYQREHPSCGGTYSGGPRWVSKFDGIAPFRKTIRLHRADSGVSPLRSLACDTRLI